MTPSATSRRFARFAWFVLAYNIAVILWGAYVRATGAGAGCGNHWPLCNGEVVPVEPSVKMLIEYTHRLSSGFDGVLVTVLLIWAFRAFPAGHAVRRAATFSMVFLVTEGALGAALVKLEHVAANQSAARAYSLSAHLVNTLTLVACLTLTAWWASGRAPSRWGSPGRWKAGLSLAGVMVLGVSGVIAALGDTLFPSRTLAEGWIQDFNPAANIFVRLRMLHPAIAAVAAAWLLYFAVTTAARRVDLRGQAWLMLGLLAGQVTAGVVNLLLSAPVWMQIMHLLLADVMWISLVILCAGTLELQHTSAD